MKWTEALKAYAEKHGKYIVPRKGTPEYDEVRAMMGDPKKVEMPLKEYKAEHERLVKVLKSGTAAERRKEAAAQVAEVKSKTDPKEPTKFIQDVVATMKKGAMTAAAKREGLKPLAYARQVLEEPEKHTLTTRRRAQFLVNIQRKDE